MYKLLIAALSLGMLSLGAQAQTTTQTSASGASAGAVSNINLIQPGSGGNGNPGVGYLNQNLNNSGMIWTLNTPSMGATQYDACTKYFTIAGPGAGLGIPLEIEQCWSMRMADAIAKYPPGSVQYNLLCKDSNVRQNDWDTNTMKCTQNIARLPKTDPRSAGYVGVPVVAVNANPLPAPAPPGGAAQAAPTFANGAAPLPRCSATVRDRCISG